MKVLVTYFSASGETKKLAENIARIRNWDLVEIEPKVKYTPADLNWNDRNSRSSQEMQDPASRPELKQAITVSGYDTILVGFPIWWGQAPRIIETFLESEDFSGKAIIPFATSGGSGMGRSADLLQKLVPDAFVQNGCVLRADSSAKEIEQWLKTWQR